MIEENIGLQTREGTAVPLAGVSVKADITGRGCRVTVRQRFENREPVPIEAVYKFPLPEGAAVCGFRALIGERVITGRVEERDQAFKEYDEAMARGDGAYLLDEERPNIFTLSAGNLNPGNSANIEISYVTLLDSHDCGVRFFLPTTISPRYVPHDMPDEGGIPVADMVNPPFSLDVPYGLSLNVAVHGAGGVESVESPSHTIRTRFQGDEVAVEFSSGTAAMDRDFVLNIGYREAFSSRCYVVTKDKEAYAEFDFILPENDGKESGEGSEIIFVLDCSGSMQGSSITQARKALEIFLRGLANGTRFNIYRFGSTFTKLFPGSVSYDSGSCGKAISWLNSIDADLGGTELAKPIADIYAVSPEGKARSVVIITDGEIGNEEQVAGMVIANAIRTRVFTVGIGHSANEYLMKRLARASGGDAEMIAPGERIEPPIVRLFKKVTNSAPLDISIKWWNSAEQAPYAPAVWSGTVTSIFARLSGKELPEDMVLMARQGGVDRKWAVPVVEITGDNTAVTTLWARERIRELEEGAAGKSGSKQTARKTGQVKQEIIGLAKAFGLMSRETSYVAVEERVEKDRATAEAVLRKVPVMYAHGWHGMDARVETMERDLSSQERVCFKTSYVSAPAKRMAQAKRAAMPHIDDIAPCMEPSSVSLGKPPIAPRYDAGDDLMMTLLALQRPEGGFAYKSDVANKCGVTDVAIKTAGAKMHCEDACDYLMVMWSVLVLEILRQKFAHRDAIWRPITVKTESWMRGQLRKAKPAVDGKPIEVWAREFVNNLPTRIP